MVPIDRTCPWVPPPSFPLQGGCLEGSTTDPMRIQRGEGLPWDVWEGQLSTEGQG